MASTQPKGTRGGGSGGGSGGGPSDGDGGREPFEEDEGAIRVHEAYIEHRLGGGEKASTQTYLRAQRQFRRLPGAIRSRPDIALPERRKDEPGEDDGGDKPPSDGDRGKK